MFELTNEQRSFLGLEAVSPSWERVSLPRSRYDSYDTVLYVENTPPIETPCGIISNAVIRKHIQTAQNADGHVTYYVENSVNGRLSEDGRLLPVTAKGRPARLTAASAEKCPGKHGMSISYVTHSHGWVSLWNADTEQNYPIGDGDTDDLPAWLETWCAESTPEDQKDLAAFLARKRVNVKYREGDYFRFRFDRRTWGYGRLLMVWADLAREKRPYWQVLMTKPVVISFYRTIDTTGDKTPQELDALPHLPPQNLMDNLLFYGEMEIIGHAPLNRNAWQYPIHCGSSIDAREHAILFQSDRVYRRLDYQPGAFPSDLPKKSASRNGVIGWTPDVTRRIMEDCIAKQSDQPYWDQPYMRLKDDLNHPANAEARARILSFWQIPDPIPQPDD